MLPPVPWSPFRIIPFPGSAEKHDFHHSQNMGNFASFFCWWDMLMGTDIAYIKFKAPQEKISRKVE
jgi:sterol desaturase/sphingolipid hydroxylase (fatty acid hydroxylase superfamily)